MSIIGAVSATPPNSALQAIQMPAKPDRDADEATETKLAKAAETASPRTVDIKA
ncbi:MAG TPA: hypothetical protein VND19_05800 [Acetobacteraceae bacterium]|nr:hypothetical protein [Acetobacteraceae bacterium]